jgi:hypothetical protein
MNTAATAERINFAVDFRCGFPMYLYHSEIMKSTAKLIRSVYCPSGLIEGAKAMTQGCESAK